MKLEHRYKIGKKDGNKTSDEIYTKILYNKLIDPSINFSRLERNKKSKKSNDIFAKKYSPYLNLKEIKIIQEKTKKELNGNLVDYLNKIKNDIESSGDQNLYSNVILMENMLKASLPTYIIYYHY